MPYGRVKLKVTKWQENILRQFSAFYGLCFTLLNFYSSFPSHNVFPLSNKIILGIFNNSLGIQSLKSVKVKILIWWPQTAYFVSKYFLLVFTIFFPCLIFYSWKLKHVLKGKLETGCVLCFIPKIFQVWWCINHK